MSLEAAIAQAKAYEAEASSKRQKETSEAAQKLLQAKSPKFLEELAAVFSAETLEALNLRLAPSPDSRAKHHVEAEFEYKGRFFILQYGQLQNEDYLDRWRLICYSLKDPNTYLDEHTFNGKVNDYRLLLSIDELSQIPLPPPKPEESEDPEAARIRRAAENGRCLAFSNEEGLTKREAFAKEAMKGLLASHAVSISSNTAAQTVARLAIEQADALLLGLED